MIYKFFKSFYIPKTWMNEFKHGNELYSDVTNQFGEKHYYLTEFIKGVITYRESLSGKILDSEELNELMEEYYETYNPKPYKKTRDSFRKKAHEQLG